MSTLLPFPSATTPPRAPSSWTFWKVDFCRGVHDEALVQEDLDREHDHEQTLRTAIEATGWSTATAVAATLAFASVAILDLVILGGLVDRLASTAGRSSTAAVLLRYGLPLGVLCLEVLVGLRMHDLRERLRKPELSGQLLAGDGAHARGSDRRELWAWRVAAVLFSLSLAGLAFVSDWSTLEVVGTMLGVVPLGHTAAPFFAGALALFGHLTLLFGASSIRNAEIAVGLRLAWLLSRRRVRKARQQLASAHRRAMSAYLMLEQVGPGPGVGVEVGSLPAYAVEWIHRHALSPPAPRHPEGDSAMAEPVLLSAERASSEDVEAGGAPPRRS